MSGSAHNLQVRSVEVFAVKRARSKLACGQHLWVVLTLLGMPNRG